MMLMGVPAFAQNGVNLTVLVPFNLATNGGQAWSPLIQATDGSLYGTTATGGAGGGGTLFKLDTNGVLTTLGNLVSTNGGEAQGKIVLGTNGTFYGMDTVGGSNSAGQIWSVTAGGVFSDLWSFNTTNGFNVYGGLTLGNDGALYGVTSGGGTNAGQYGGGAGTIFKITLDGTFTSLLSFSNTNGNQPVGGLTLGRDGNFYGTTYGGGTTYTTNYAGDGTIFRMTPDGVLTTLASFNGTNGSESLSPLVEGLDGVFYGTTGAGGAYGDGTVFKVTTNGVLTSLFSFNYTDGNRPMAGLIQASDGYFYGATSSGGTNGSGFGSGAGTIFRISANGAFATVFEFGDTNGFMPQANLLQGRDGLFYGLTTSGAGKLFYGVIYGLAVPGASAPMVAPAINGDAINLNWVPLIGRTYQVEYKTDLTQTNWANFGGTMVATNSPMTVMDAIGAGSKMYRVVLLP